MDWIRFYLLLYTKGKTNNLDILINMEKNIILIFRKCNSTFEMIIYKLIIRILNGELVNFDLSSILLGLILIYKDSMELLFKGISSEKYKEQRIIM